VYQSPLLCGFNVPFKGVSLNVTPKTTEQNLKIRGDKSINNHVNNIGSAYRRCADVRIGADAVNDTVMPEPA